MDLRDTPPAAVHRAFRFGMPADAWVVAEFARLLPELGAPPPGRLEVLRLRQAGSEAMRFWRLRGLTALLIDDLQFAEDVSLEWLLAWLAEAPLGPPVLLTVRAGEVPPMLTQAFADRPADEVAELSLGPLSSPATAALLESLDVGSRRAATRRARCTPAPAGIRCSSSRSCAPTRRRGSPALERTRPAPRSVSARSNRGWGIRKARCVRSAK